MLWTISRRHKKPTNKYIYMQKQHKTEKSSKGNVKHKGIYIDLALVLKGRKLFCTEIKTRK